MRYDRWHLSNWSQSVNKPYGQVTFPAPVKCSSVLPHSEFRRVPTFSRHQSPWPQSCQDVAFLSELDCPELFRGACNAACRVAGTAEKLWAIEFTEKRYVLTALGPGRLMARESWYAPEFGMRQHRTTLHWSWEGDLPVRLIYTLTPIGEMPPIISHCLGQELVEIDRISLRLN